MGEGGEDKAWLIRPRESARAYEAFDLYCTLGARRSLELVRQEIGERSGVKTSKRHIETWSARWDWVERARAWDEHEAGLRAAARERKVIEAEELIKDSSVEVVGAMLSIIHDEDELGAARVSAAKDLLDRAQVGKRKQESTLIATGDIADAIADVLGAASLTPKPGADGG